MERFIQEFFCIQGKVALVAGGYGGIGKAISEGYGDPVIPDRNSRSEA